MAEWFEKVKSAGISLERINIFGLIVLVIGAITCFCAGEIANKLFANRDAAPKAIKLISLAVCVVGFIITVYC